MLHSRGVPYRTNSLNLPRPTQTQPEECRLHAFLPVAYLTRKRPDYTRLHVLACPCLSLPVNDLAVVGVESHTAHFQSLNPRSQGWSSTCPVVSLHYWLLSRAWPLIKVASLKAQLSSATEDGQKRLELAHREFNIVSAMAGQKAQLRLAR